MRDKALMMKHSRRDYIKGSNGNKNNSISRRLVPRNVNKKMCCVRMTSNDVVWSWLLSTLQLTCSRAEGSRRVIQLGKHRSNIEINNYRCRHKGKTFMKSLWFITWNGWATFRGHYTPRHFLLHRNPNHYPNLNLNSYTDTNPDPNHYSNSTVAVSRSKGVRLVFWFPQKEILNFHTSSFNVLLTHYQL